MNSLNTQSKTTRRLKRGSPTPREAEPSSQNAAWSKPNDQNDYEVGSTLFDEYFEKEGKQRDVDYLVQRSKSGWGVWLPLVAVAIAGTIVFYKTIISGLVWASIGALLAAFVYCTVVVSWWCYRACMWLRRRGANKSALMLAVVASGGILFFSLIMTVSAMASNPKYGTIINQGIATFLPHKNHLVYRTQDGSHIFNAEGRMVGAEEIKQSLLKPAILAIEDERYPSRLEGPVDFVATVRALVKTVIYGRRQGGSTIQLQVAKMLMGLQRVELHDKDVQTLLAFRLEQRVADPDELLALYSNLCQVSGNRRGMADAAYDFFGVTDLRSLTIEQAALLAGLLKSPDGFNPRTHRQAALDRRNLVISKMRELGFISEQQLQTAVSTDIQLEPGLKKYELLVRAANSVHGVGK